MKYEIEMTEQDIKDLRAVRNYFGENDKTMFEHKAYAILDRLVKKLNTPIVSKSESIKREPAVCDHHWLGVGDWDGYAMEQCTKCNLFREAN